MTQPPLTFNAWLRYGLIRDSLNQLNGIGSALEIGTGEGAMGARLAGRFSYVGLELDPISYERARARIQEKGLGRVLLGDLAALDQSERFDLVYAFEVLEHIEDDAAALRQWRERLRPGGVLMLSVPANQDRFGPGDRKAGHYRRYERAGMTELLISAGFSDPEILSYGFPLGYLLEWARNAIARRSATGAKGEQTSASGRWLQPPEGLGGATKIMTAPFRLLQRPFLHGRMGTGLVVVARRSG